MTLLDLIYAVMDKSGQADYYIDVEYWALFLNSVRTIQPCYKSNAYSEGMCCFINSSPEYRKIKNNRLFVLYKPCYSHRDLLINCEVNNYE